MTQNAWDLEYVRKGMPSSFRDDPSGVLRWTLNNWKDLAGVPLPKSCLDVGCGTGRNAIHMALLGIRVVAFDLSPEAIKIAERRKMECAAGKDVVFLQHDLSKGLLGSPRDFELVSDVFVYKHQMSADLRRNYRSEVRRVLAPHGKFLVSLAERSDGYYSGCPGIVAPDGSAGRAIIDPVAGVGSVLFDLPELVEEMSDRFRLEMSWHKKKKGPMYGNTYDRRTLATVWTAAEEDSAA